MVADVMPWGKHKGKPLEKLPTPYVMWMARECKLSTSLRRAVENELALRGLAPPPAPQCSPRSCPRCPAGTGMNYRWQEDRAGRKRIGGRCVRCHRHVWFAPHRQPYSDLASAAASPTPILDALTRLEDLGVQLHSDGATVWVGSEDWRRVPHDLHALVRQCSHTLARMIGRTELPS